MPFYGVLRAGGERDPAARRLVRAARLRRGGRRRSWRRTVSLFRDLATVRAGATVAVDAFRATEVKRPAETFEGRSTVQVRGAWSHEKRSFAAGGLFVPVAQPHARLAAQLLEPEAPDSLTSWGYFDTVFEQKEYMEDYVLEAVAEKMLARARGQGRVGAAAEGLGVRQESARAPRLLLQEARLVGRPARPSAGVPAAGGALSALTSPCARISIATHFPTEPPMASPRTRYFAKKLFELTGFVPIGAFLIEHLYSNFQAVGPGGARALRQRGQGSADQPDHHLPRDRRHRAAAALPRRLRPVRRLAGAPQRRRLRLPAQLDLSVSARHRRASCSSISATTCGTRGWCRCSTPTTPLLQHVDGQRAGLVARTCTTTSSRPTSAYRCCGSTSSASPARCSTSPTGCGTSASTGA